jgi:phosphoserine phosphatase
MSEVLVLVADRDAMVLAQPLINTLREVLRGRAPTVLAPGEAVEFAVRDTAEVERVRAVLGTTPVDLLLVPAEGRRKQILIADMDSTIVTGETLDELAAFAGLGEEIAAITRHSMNGELDFSAALRARVAMLKGLALEALEKTWAGVRITPGAAELVGTMRAQGAHTALVSGGFTFFTSRVAARLGFAAHRANELLHEGGKLTGAVAEPILDRDAKLSTLKELAAARGVGLAACLAVGDGANDLAMLRAAGMGIAFHAKPVVAREVRLQVNHSGLRALLFAQGFRAEEFAVFKA